MNLALKRSARMAWNAVMRFGCCLCICGILLGAAAVPRAKAVATEAAVVGFSPAILALYMKSAGLSLTATSSAAGAAAMTEMIGGYAAATGTTASAVSSSIAAGTVISAAGTVILGVAAVAALAAITAWAIDKYGLKAGDESVPISPGGDGSVIVGDSMLYNGVELPALPEWDIEAYPYATITRVDQFNRYDLNIAPYPWFHDGTYFYWIAERQCVNLHYRFYDGTDAWKFEGNYSRSAGQKVTSANVFWSNNDVLNSGGSVYLAASYPVDPNVPTVSVDESFESAIEIPDTKQMVIDVGAGEGATEETVYNLVFNQIADGTLDPTYEVEDVDPGTEDPDPEPDPDPGDNPGSGTEDLPDPESLGLADLGEALTTRFPFSIPWDLYRAVKLLVAPAEAPYFEIDFLQPIAYRLPKGWQGSTTIVFDMAEYELIGQVSRWTSTVGFCLALIAGSKRYIWMS